MKKEGSFFASISFEVQQKGNSKDNIKVHINKKRKYVLMSTFEVPNLGLLLGQQMSLSTKSFFHMKYEGRKGTFFLML